MSQQPIRIAILGQGRSGYGIHAKWLAQDAKRYKIVAVADSLPERRAEAEREFGVTTYEDYKHLLRDHSHGAEVVVNALPSFLHPQGTIDALKAGYHIICEKPAARTAKGFDRMVKAAEDNRKLLLPFQNSRFNPCFQQSLAVLKSGVLGKPVHIRMNWSSFGRRWDWQCLQEFWGGNLLNTGPHPLDQAVVFLGGKTPKVTCCMRSENPFGDAENFAALYLQAKDAPLIEVVVSSFQAYPQGDILNISATHGGLTSTNDEVRWKYFDPAAAPKHKNNGTWSDNRQMCVEQLAWTEQRWARPDSAMPFFEEMSKSFYENAYGVIRRGKPRAIRLEEVRRQIEILETCHRQNRMAKWKRKFLGKQA